MYNALTNTEGIFMLNFTQAVERVLLIEQGYTNNPKDKGGETNFGITIGVARENGYGGKMRDMNRTQAIMIYKTEYWDKVKADKLPSALAFQVFDASVNHGQSRAIKFLQIALGFDKPNQDGKIGDMTLKAVSKTNLNSLLFRFFAARNRFYTGLSDDQWGTFGKGWENRMSNNMIYAATDLEA